MIGGLSVNEVSNIERIVEKLDTHEVYFLADHVTTPKTFMEDLKMLVNQKKWIRKWYLLNYVIFWIFEPVKFNRIDTACIID